MSTDPYEIAIPQDSEIAERASVTLAATRRRPPFDLYRETCVRRLVNGKWNWLGLRSDGRWWFFGSAFTIYAKLNRK